jgi:hypothetical protein
MNIITRASHNPIILTLTTSQRLILLVQSPNNVYQSKPWLQQYFFSPKSNASLTHEILFYPLFHNKQKLLHSKWFISRTNYPAAFKFIHVSFEGWYLLKTRWVFSSNAVHVLARELFSPTC